MGNTILINSFRYPPPPAPCDTFYNNAVILVDFDGVDGATSATDASRSAHTLTFGGTAQLDTDITKFGSASLLLDGDSDYVDVPTSTDFDFGTNPFTIELHFRLDTLGKRHCLISKYGSTLNTTADWALIYESSGTYGDERDNHLRFVWTTDGTTVQDYALRTGTIAIDTWYHVAVCRDNKFGNGLAIFLDGVRQAPSTIDLDSIADDDVFYSSEPIHIGKIDPTVGDKLYLDGNIDNVRITKGVARYGDGIDTPEAAYPTSAPADPNFADVELLLNMDGADGGTTFTDLSNNGYTVTRAGVTTSNTQVKFGTAAAEITGGLGESLTVTGSLINETMSFTIECWMYLIPPAVGGASREASGPFHPIAYNYNGTGGGAEQGFYVDQTGIIRFYRGSAYTGAGAASIASSGTTVPFNEWAHIAISYDKPNDACYIFINGECVKNGASLNGGWYDSPNPWRIGDWYHVGYPQWRSTMNGYIDDYRVSSIARYTNDFTPPTQEFAEEACSVAGDITLIENYTSVDQTVSNWESGQTWNNFWGWGWKPDGTKFVTVNNSNDRMYGFDFGTPFDFTTTSNNSANPGQSVQVVGLDVMFNEDGTKYSKWSWYLNNAMVTYNAATPYEPKTTDTQISTANFGSYSNSDAEAYWIDRSGTHLFIMTAGNSPDKIIHFKMYEPWDVTTAVQQSDEFIMTGYSTNNRMYVSPTGRDMLFSDSAAATPLWHFRMSEPYNLNTMIEVSQLDISSFGPRGGGVWMPDDGSKLILGPGANDSYDIQVRSVP